MLLAHSYGATVALCAADFLHPGGLAAVVALWGAGAAVGAGVAATGFARAVVAGWLAAILANRIPLALLALGL